MSVYKRICTLRVWGLARDAVEITSVLNAQEFFTAWQQQRITCFARTPFAGTYTWVPTCKCCHGKAFGEGSMFV